VPYDDGAVRHDWTAEQIRAIHDTPLTDLVWRAQAVHRRHHDPAEIQRASLLSIKTGACPEDCAYCPQSAHHKEVRIDREGLMAVDDVLAKARTAKAAGASRFCMGAAWSRVRDGAEFDAVLDMVRGVRAMDMEACVTLGMLTRAQAERLAEAGLTAYNHNLDTSPDFYKEIISTRTFDDRLETLGFAREAGVELCTGGIIGMGESIDDRCAMLQTLANLDPQPESVPLNALVPVDGTPLAARETVHPFELVRMIATARILMPESRVRLSAGRSEMSDEAQALCFLAGANSVFYGDKLLTTPNADAGGDDALLAQVAGAD
jgi:biotin synthase